MTVYVSFWEAHNGEVRIIGVYTSRQEARNAIAGHPFESTGDLYIVEMEMGKTYTPATMVGAEV